jgi:hypothetical protein
MLGSGKRQKAPAKPKATPTPAQRSVKYLGLDAAFSTPRQSMEKNFLDIPPL